MQSMRKIFGWMIIGTMIGAAGAVAAEESPCASYICIEADTGVVISEYNADEKRPAASMVKMVMMLMVSEGLDAGLWTLDTPIIATQHAQNMGGTQVFLKAGEERTVGELILATAIASANDATMALAEGLWGSEQAYLQAMNARIRDWGMMDSEFHSVHGLPPDAGTPPDQTTARDMAILGQWCARDERVMNWVRHQELVFRPGEATKFNTNKLLWRMEECDGLKTGYTRASGFCLTSTAMRDGIRVISVVMGCDNKYRRFDLAETLLQTGLAEMRRVPLLMAGQTLDHKIHIPNSIHREISPLAQEDMLIVVKEAELSRIELVWDLPARLQAPLEAGMVLGEVRAVIDGQVRGSISAILDVDIPEAGWRWKLVQGAAAYQDDVEYGGGG